jgi:predicted PurR-regulated permease PerM
VAIETRAFDLPRSPSGLAPAQPIKDCPAIPHFIHPGFDSRHCDQPGESMALPSSPSARTSHILHHLRDRVSTGNNRRVRRPGFGSGIDATYEGLSRRSLEEGGWPALVTHTADRVVDALATRLPLNAAAIREELLDGMRTVTGYLRNNAGAAIGDMTSVLITGLLTTIFLYFLLRHGEDWVGRLDALTPLDPRVSTGLFRTVHDSVVANVNGVLAVAFGQGLLLSLGFWVVGVGSPVLWGAIGGLASIIPVVGSPLVWVPVVIAFIFMGAYWKALLLGIWCVLVIGSVDNVLRPFVVGARDKQHPMLIALAAIGGTYAFGILGILLGPLVLSLVAALLKEIQALVSPREIEIDEAHSVERDCAPQ